MHIRISASIQSQCPDVGRSGRPSRCETDLHSLLCGNSVGCFVDEVGCMEADDVHPQDFSCVTSVNQLSHALALLLCKRLQRPKSKAVLHQIAVKISGGTLSKWGGIAVTAACGKDIPRVCLLQADL